ncbi:MAG: signal peptidase II [Bacilli bacterium]|nr:signal peptidase II [Bacilli bacterium]
MQVNIAFIIISSIILIDQLTKYFAYVYIRPKAKTKNKIFYLSYVENSGMAMGKLSGAYIYFYIVTIISLIALAFYANYIDFQNRLIFSIGISILMGGAMGNFLDRVFRGYVIDFITGKIFKKHLPVYNISDLCIMIGFILLIIDIIGVLLS